MKKIILAVLIVLAFGLVVTLIVVKVAGDRPDVCQGKPVACLDGR
jgi:hypothetical protein